MINDLITTNDLTNSNVVTPGHKEIGVIEDVAIDRSSGRVAYMILKTTGFMGFGEKRFPIPFGAFYTDTNESDKVILDVDRERLENAPVIEIDNNEDFNFTEFVLKVYNYYGIKPYLKDYSDELEMDLNTTAPSPLTMSQARLKNNRFDNSHKRAHDRHSTHIGLGVNS